MKKLILILVCLPLFLFSQKEVEYDRTMSVSQFAKELKEAAVNGLDYTLDNCKITYDPTHDKQADITRYEKLSVEYDRTVSVSQFAKELKEAAVNGLVMEDALIRDIRFSDSSKVTISNCTFGDQDKIPERHGISLNFTNCKFSHLQFDNNIITEIILDSIIASNLSFYDSRSHDNEDISDGHGLTLTNSFIKKLIIEENREESKNAFDKRQYGASRMTLRSYHLIQKNSISHMQVKDIGGLEIDNNKLGFLKIAGENEEISISNNVFKLYLDNISNTVQVDDKLTCHLRIKKGITIGYANIRTLLFEFNKQSNNDLDKIELITFLEKNKNIRINSSSFNKKNSNDFLNDSLKFNYSKEHDLKIYNSGIGTLSLDKNRFNAITIQNNLISDELEVVENEGSIHFLNNNIIQPNLIYIDTNFFYHFNFL